MILDQLEDTADTGNVFVGQQTWSCINCNNPGRPNRAQMQTVKVTAINGNNVTITPGLYMPNWRASQSPGAYWGDGTLPVTGDGVENMTLDSSGNTTGGGIITFYGATGSWVKGIRSINAEDSHVKFWYGNLFNTVQDSYFFGSQGHGYTSSQSYGVNGYTGSAELVQNNVFQHIATSMQMEDHQGSVFGYNLAIDSFNAQAISWALGMASAHAPGNNYLLWEGNVLLADSILDDFHGPADFITFFRNRMTGWEPLGTNNTSALINQAWSRYTNVVGNVMGTAGYHINYASVQGDGSDAQGHQLCDESIYALGWGGNCTTWPPFPNCQMNGCPQSDPLVATTILRWGNWDTVTNGTMSNTSEVPSGISLYANPVPSSQILPISLYLSSQPSFWSTPWGTPSWPAIGPDVAGGNIAGIAGHANMIPSQLCFNNSPADPNYPITSQDLTTDPNVTSVLLFNAANCYPADYATIMNVTPLPGDINLDHVVNSLDYSILNSHWFQNYAPADLNGDGIVNSLDFAILKSNWGKTW